MEKKNTNHHFLEDHSEKELQNKHKDLLGYDLPKNYFTKSKEIILNSLPVEDTSEIKYKKGHSFYTYPIAASILILIGFGIWMANQKKSSGIEPPQMVNKTVLPNSEQDILLESLLIEDNEVNTYFDSSIMENLLAENNKVIEIDNLLINSLLINDSLSEDYIDKNLTEIIVF